MKESKESQQYCPEDPHTFTSLTWARGCHVHPGKQSRLAARSRGLFRQHRSLLSTPQAAARSSINRARKAVCEVARAELRTACAAEEVRPRAQVWMEPVRPSPTHFKDPQFDTVLRRDRFGCVLAVPAKF